MNCFSDGHDYSNEPVQVRVPIPHTGVLAFGYDANIVNLTGGVSLNSLFDYSINLLNELCRERRQAASFL